MLASYTANLAAFLTSDRISNDISSAEDLVKQNKVKYGAVKDGSTHKFFRYSNFSTYQRMGIVMDNAGDVVLTDSNQKGVERIFKQKPNYAFLMESVPMEYQMNQNCSLRRVGELLDSKGYGIALPLSKFISFLYVISSDSIEYFVDSPYRKFFSEAILKLSEKGELRKLKETHWNRVGGECNDPVDHDDLEISEVGGVFVVLLGGLLFALGIAIFEFLHNVEKIAIEQKVKLRQYLTLVLFHFGPKLALS
jgi:glutamate receptor, ionotropic, invertebrate